MRTIGNPYEPMYRRERRVRWQVYRELAGIIAFTLLLAYVLHLALRGLGA